MAETTPAAPVVVTPNRLGTLTLVSLGFNALFVLFLLVGLVIHHHGMKRRAHEEFLRGRAWADEGSHGGMGFRPHGFGGDRRGWDQGMGMGREDGPGGCGGGFGRGGEREEGPGGFHGPMGRGFGGPEGMMHPPIAMEVTDHIMDHLIDTLALTDAESAQIRPVIEQQVAQMQKDMEAAKQARIKSMADTTAKIRPLLNADQQKQLDALKTAEEPGLTPPPPGPLPDDQAKSKPE